MKKSRRVSALLLAALFAAGSLCACAAGDVNGGFTPDPGKAFESPRPLPTAAFTASPTEEATAEPTPAVTDAPAPEPAELEAAFRDIKLPADVKHDYFAIPGELLALMTEGDREMYRRVALAYFSGESEAEIPQGIGEFPNLWRVVDMYFPLFFEDVDDESIAVKHGRIVWEYKGSAKEHEKTIRDFEARVDELLAPVRESDSFIMQVLTLYQHFTSGIVYNGIGLDGVDRNEPPYLYDHAADAIMRNTGVCWCFARAYNFLLCQIGAKSLTVHGLRRGDGAIHEWTVFRFKDKWRYADPTWDLGGNALNFFGFTCVTREMDGYPEQDVSVLEGHSLRASKYFEVTDTFYKSLYTGMCSGEWYELDHENGQIVFYETDYSIFSQPTPKEHCRFDPETAEYQFFD